MALGRALFWLFVGVWALSTLGSCVFLFLVLQKPTYDESDPDYDRYVQIFRRLEKGLDRRDPIGPSIVDLSSLNDGRWTTACLFGGYTDPLREMRSLGASIDARDEARLVEARTIGFRISSVEEFEILIAYTDYANRAHFIHFAQGIGPTGQYLEQCISKPDTTMILGSP